MIALEKDIQNVKIVMITARYTKIVILVMALGKSKKLVELATAKEK
jgi:hypothetical protein